MLTTLDLRGTSPDVPSDLPRPDQAGDEPVAGVRAILAEVARRGDEALRELTRRFDGVEIGELRVPVSEVRAAPDRVGAELASALRAAAGAIEAFHRNGLAAPQTFAKDGVEITDLLLPVDRVGVYAPGGRATYPSSVLMTAIPARVAGVGTIACCAPPGPDGAVATTILAAAAIAGVDEVYRVGGAQAIGALAYGTESIRKVDVVVGPGSKWVSIAEREVRGTVGVPAAFAGPSEVVVVADGTAPVEWAAIDVIVQAEHGPDGFAWLVTWSEEVAAAVSESVARLVAASPRGDETRAALESGGYAVIVDDPEHAMAVVNAIAPEHLELMVEDPGRLVALVRNAGAVFVGPFAPASFGDYLAGPSHVLPTFGTARFASVLGVEDFLRRSHVISFTEKAARRVAPDVAAIADAERLPAHAESARLRAGKPTWSAR
ncbi:MAG: histidinol dehydrogenase [Acidimicrobiales bacterium]